MCATLKFSFTVFILTEENNSVFGLGSNIQSSKAHKLHNSYFKFDSTLDNLLFIVLYSH